MLRALPHVIGFVLPPLIVWSVALGGVWTFLPLVVVYVALPLADQGLNVENPSGAVAQDLSENAWFRAVTWIWVPTQIGLVFWVLAAVAEGRPNPVEIVGLTLSLGVTNGGIGITFAHELIHRSRRFERALGETLLASVCYMHYTIEHVHGHHRHVGTPQDPATARFGEPSYAFIVRSVLGGVRSAWRIEARRLAKQGRPVWHPSNRMLRYACVQAAVNAAVLSVFGWLALAVFLGQSIVAFSLLEIINYIEHYGLFRREIAPGRYERVEPWHSWNSSHRVSNWILINLARHADHHLTASKRYQVLHTLDAAPQLPAGYSAMVLLALAPPLWRRVMDPRVEQWRNAHR
jgi:alkane 1-monooxygenase